MNQALFYIRLRMTLILILTNNPSNPTKSKVLRQVEFLKQTEYRLDIRSTILRNLHFSRRNNKKHVSSSRNQQQMMECCRRCQSNF